MSAEATRTLAPASGLVQAKSNPRSHGRGLRLIPYAIAQRRGKDGMRVSNHRQVAPSPEYGSRHREHRRSTVPVVTHATNGPGAAKRDRFACWCDLTVFSIRCRSSDISVQYEERAGSRSLSHAISASTNRRQRTMSGPHSRVRTPPRELPDPR